MKTRFYLSRLALALSITCTLAAHVAYAADLPNTSSIHQIQITSQQMQAMNIQVAVLEKNSASFMSMPAQVILPPNSEQVVSAPLSGLITHLYVQQNQQVKKGAPLIRIVSAELGQLQLQLLQAASRLDLSMQQAQREKALFVQGIIPERRIQEAQANLNESEANFSHAKASLRLVGMSVSGINKIIRTQQLEDSLLITSPQSGVVTQLEVKLGQRVDASNSILHVAQIAPLWLEVNVPSSHARSWKIGDQIQIESHEKQAVFATIQSVSPIIISASQTIALRAVVNSDKNILQAGQMVNVKLPISLPKNNSQKTIWTVPLASVVYEGKQAYVFVKNLKGFQPSEVLVVASAGQNLSTAGELKVNDQIAVSGLVALKAAWLKLKEAP